MTSVLQDEISLADWYANYGRHDLPWRLTQDRWAVLVSEIMLHQTQVQRVLRAWPDFMKKFPTPAATAKTGVGEVIKAWGGLGYPRRARWLWESARIIAKQGWPEDLEDLPGVGQYTAGAIRCEVDDENVPALDVNIRRVVERVQGTKLTVRQAEVAMSEVGGPLHGRDRLLALMDIGALLCTRRDPNCNACPHYALCKTRGPLQGETHYRQGRFEGSFRQRRGRIMVMLREGPVDLKLVDADALNSLVGDGLASITGTTAHLPQ